MSTSFLAIFYAYFPFQLESSLRLSQARLYQSSAHSPTSPHNPNRDKLQSASEGDRGLAVMDPISVLSLATACVTLAGRVAAAASAIEAVANADRAVAGAPRR